MTEEVHPSICGLRPHAFHLKPPHWQAHPNFLSHPCGMTAPSRLKGLIRKICAPKGEVGLRKKIKSVDPERSCAMRTGEGEGTPRPKGRGKVGVPARSRGPYNPKNTSTLFAEKCRQFPCSHHLLSLIHLHPFLKLKNMPWTGVQGISSISFLNLKSSSRCSRHNCSRRSFFRIYGRSPSSE
jgi:hypothetical protein